MKKILFALMACAALNGCGAAERISNIGKPPDMAKIVNPTTQPGYQPVSFPMPAPQVVTQERNSLWVSNRQTFFKDQRANNVGDIITVNIKIDDQAKLDNQTEKKRQSSEDAAAPNFLGIEGQLHKVFPETVDPTKLIGLSGDSDHKGTGTVDRKEQIEVKLAAFVTQL